MLKLTNFLVIIFVCAVCMAEDAVTVPGMVTATKLNVRVKPGTNYTIVAQLKKDGKVQVVGADGKWVEIVAPTDAAVWVAAQFIENGQAKSNVQLRSGPGIAYRAYGTMPLGSRVEILDRSRPGWFRIVPPPFLKAWVGAEFVQYDADKLAALKLAKQQAENVAAKQSAVKKAEKTAKTEIKQPALPFVKGTEKQVSLEGVVLPLKTGAVHVTHALAKKSNGKLVPICYLHSNGNSLSVWQERNIRIKGKEQLVKGWSLPVVEVEKVIPAW